MGISHALAWAGYRYTSTIIDDIQYQVAFFSLFAFMVCAVREYTNRDLGINSIMISVLGTVVSLTVSFKTSSAYTRWWEGRNIWATVTSNSRHLAMLIWLHVPNAKPTPKDTPPLPKSKKKHRHRHHHRHESASKQSSPHPLASMAAVNAESEPAEILQEAEEGYGLTRMPRKQSLKFDGVVSEGSAVYPAGLDREGRRELTGDAGSTTTSCMTGGCVGEKAKGKEGKEKDHGVDKVLSKQEELKMRAQVAGMVEKRTYIGLTKPGPNPLGFSAAFEACKERDVPDLSLPKADKVDEKHRHRSRRHRHRHRHQRSDAHSSSTSSSDSSSSSASDSDSETEPEVDKEEQAAEGLLTAKHIKPLPKTVRDLELALTANWRTISTETESFIGKPRQQLENRSGVEVAVMTL